MTALPHRKPGAGEVVWYYTEFSAKRGDANSLNYITSHIAKPETKRQAATIARAAHVNLLAHRDKGYFHIKIRRGDSGLDYHVVMRNPDPDAGPHAVISVLSLEYGFEAKLPSGARVKVPGAWILHDAAGLPRKEK